MKVWRGSLFVCWIMLVTVAAINDSGPIKIFLKHRRADIEIVDGIRLRIYHNEELVYDAEIGKLMPMVGRPTWNKSDDDFTLHVHWDNGLKLDISIVGEDFPGVRLKWTAPATLDYLEDCFEIGKSNWYGGSELRVQPWPIQNQSLPSTAYITGDVTGGVLERYFLSSAGFAYYVDETVPLFVSLTRESNIGLCFKTSFVTPYVNSNGRQLTLSYSTIVGSDLLDVHRKVVRNFFGFPIGIPMEKMIRLPIWSTRNVYSKYVNQTKVLQFAREIQQHGFTANQIEIDDNWESCYGDEIFDPVKFPNPVGMVNSLKLQGIDVTLWVHPFVNVECTRFKEGDERHYFISNDGFNTTSITPWWNGNAAVIDVTNSEAAQWWAQSLNNIRHEFGIASFKFDAGETNYFPETGYYHKEDDLHRGIFSNKYTSFASQFGSQIEVRNGYLTQQLPIFVRILDRDSTWGLDNGLKSVITSALHFGIVGYPFVLPDMIAGNGFGIDPTRELFIRWVQVNAFLPTMQFSFTPWSFDQEVTNISLKMVALHANISDVIISAALCSTIDGSPIIRPLWWISPNDTTAQIVNDEFLVGDTYLVAPIVSEGESSRDIYLPQGRWKDEISGEEISGPVWLRNYHVALEDIPYFYNLNN